MADTMQGIRVTRNIGGKDVTFESGTLAKLAAGSVVVTAGETQVLVTCTSGPAREGIDFFPLTVDVEERMYAAGKIPGGFFRREGRPSETAILTARLIDRPLRPTFRKGFRQEVHVVCTVLSADLANPYDIPGINGAGVAAMLAALPFEGPVAGVRLALAGGRWLVNPTYQEADLGTFDMVVAGRRNDQGGVDILMVEAEAPETALDHIADGGTAPTEEVVAEGLEEAKRVIGEIIDLQREFMEAVGGAEREFPMDADVDEEIQRAIDEFARGRLSEALQIAEKAQRNEAVDRVREEMETHLSGLWEEEAYQGRANVVARVFKDLQKDVMRRRVVDAGVRMDGRKTDELRPISCAVGLVPRAHGSGLFQRGETQVLNVTTLGMLRMTQQIDTLDPDDTKRYIHHYNFPPFSTGETGFMRGPKRREIGHGALAERALLPVIPSEEDFPYAIRLVSDVLMSNGSTSMASVCASTLSLMDAGVPIKAPVAGIAMGLIAEGGEFVTLTDILGAEDALGDMDFKVAGTKDFVTALQLDTKVTGLPTEVLVGALEQARAARLQILDKMLEAISEPREVPSEKAPRVMTKQIPVDKIGEVIGPKGKRINEIIAVTGADIDIQDDGTVFIGAREGEGAERASQMIDEILNPRMPEIGEVFHGKVVKTTTFGAFVNILPGTDGLVHISELRKGGERVQTVEDVVNIGDELDVVVLKIEQGLKPKIGLRPIWEGETPPTVDEINAEQAAKESRPPRDRDRDRDGGERRGDRGDRGRRRPPRRREEA
ncbi:MAG TPA: polyribonucleotide nucleotidyltransferase [Actinomycetota bacterium]|nr:polyribonucleotide nucleotidyltransferase [Actinomycetota bacterium]